VPASPNRSAPRKGGPADRAHDLVSARIQVNVTTEKKTYRIEVGQLMRSISDEPFSLTVSVR
jgi:hypothetical protein